LASDVGAVVVVSEAEENIMNARDIMTRPLRTCGLDTPLDVASHLMANDGCGALAVVNARGRLAGVLTDRDIVIAIGTSKRPASRITTDDAMTRNVYTCSPDDDISDVVQQMAEGRVRRLPVVGADGELEGLVSIDDVVLWGIEHDGVAPKAVLRAMRAICAAHHPMFETEDIEPSSVNVDLAD
jgi:CBS domain-containing protein